MKKLLAAISFLLYFAATSGIVINSHYCMKRLVSVHLFEQKAKVCGLCGMDMHENSGCCHDETKVLKLVQDQVKVPVTVYEIPAAKALVALPVDRITVPLVSGNSQRYFRHYSPPLLSAQDSYLQNAVFRI